MEAAQQPNQFEAVKARLEEIARQVDDESLSLDQALDLYEEAVKLGLQASDLLETGIEPEVEAEAEAAGEAGVQAEGKPDTGAEAEPMDNPEGAAS